MSLWASQSKLPLSTITPVSYTHLGRLDLIQLYGAYSEYTCFHEGELWRLFTYQFLHANLGHIMFNMIMQTCFFKLAGVIPADEAIGYIKKAIAKTYAKKGQELSLIHI